MADPSFFTVGQVNAWTAKLEQFSKLSRPSLARNGLGRISKRRGPAPVVGHNFCLFFLPLLLWLLPGLPLLALLGFVGLPIHKAYTAISRRVAMVTLGNSWVPNFSAAGPDRTQRKKAAVMPYNQNTRKATTQASKGKTPDEVAMELQTAKSRTLAIGRDEPFDGNNQFRGPQKCTVLTSTEEPATAHL